MKEFGGLILYILIAIGYVAFKSLGKFAQDYPSQDFAEDFEHPALLDDEKETHQKIQENKSQIKKDMPQIDDEALVKKKDYDLVKIKDVWDKTGEKQVSAVDGILPVSREDLIKGVILAEVLGPPRAKNPYYPVYKKFLPRN